MKGSAMRKACWRFLLLVDVRERLGKTRGRQNLADRPHCHVPGIVSAPKATGLRMSFSARWDPDRALEALRACKCEC